MRLYQSIARVLRRSAVCQPSNSCFPCSHSLSTTPYLTFNYRSKMAQDSPKVCVTSPSAPAAIGPYSHAVQAGGMMYISGQLGMDPASGNLVSGGVEKEAEQALTNLGAILRAGQADYQHVVKTTVLLADIQDFQAVNAVYARFFPRDPPARAAYQVAALPKNARVEIEAIAVLPK
ncbi:2-iminobutanoate/2-iminopropanoate deaminase-like [Paramacrobiotus metropolitanus]|uniref:2-iminobutanoate/2-iminopropanoate deaminase-like n=1 Tax=Paramacrobiotus metropolitanus TaxID=2943436 RepID=UPI002446338E|nr:2-iminobutanoate/2-iminopropanoate deaminase-like [Paramacrobiotus metropolitanus]